MPGPRSIAPSDLNAERSLLGAVMISPSVLVDVLPILDPSDFYAPQHQSMYQAILLLHGEGKKIDALLVRDRCSQMGSDIADETVGDMLNVTPSVSNARRYADIIVGHSRRRRVAYLMSQVANDAMDPGSDPDELIARASEAQFDMLAASRSVEIENLYTMGQFMELAEEYDTSTPWVIPDMLRQKWRGIVVAEEGAGKFVFLMQIALLVANGLDPFDPSMRIPAQRVLVVNGENPWEAMSHQVRLVQTRAQKELAHSAGGNMKIWHMEQGMDLLQRRDQAKFERVIADFQPNLIVMGPLYKLFQPSKNEMEQDTMKMIRFLDDMRVRHSTAMLIEHHAPKGDMARREIFPGGSSLWLRWPEIGMAFKVVDRDDEGHILEVDLDRFRGDRLPADWPRQLLRVDPMSHVPWGGRWPNGRIAYKRARMVEHQREMVNQ
jgi:replicative DNA helicase